MFEARADGAGQCVLPTKGWSNGLYRATGWNASGQADQWSLEVLR